jgi:integrase
MRGSIKQRSPGSWSLILDLGYVQDPTTGRRKRRQQWITVRGTKRDAENRLNTLLTEANDGTLVTPSRRTVGNWLVEWVEKAIKPPMRTPRAYDTYRGVIDRHLVPALGAIRIQTLTGLDLERYYATHAADGLAPATLAQHHHIMHGALEAAVRAQLVARNVAKFRHREAACARWPCRRDRALLDRRGRGDVPRHGESGGPAAGGVLHARLDSGMRKSELCGLLWRDVDLTEGRVRVSQQLLTGGPRRRSCRSRGRWRAPWISRRRPWISCAPTRRSRRWSSYATAGSITITGSCSRRTGATLAAGKRSAIRSK